MHHRITLTAWQPGRTCCRSGVRLISLGVLETGLQHQAEVENQRLGRESFHFPGMYGVFEDWNESKFFQPFKTWRNLSLCPTLHHEIVSFLTPVWDWCRSLCVGLSGETQWAGRSHPTIRQQFLQLTRWKQLLCSTPHKTLNKLLHICAGRRDRYSLSASLPAHGTARQSWRGCGYQVSNEEECECR